MKKRLLFGFLIVFMLSLAYLSQAQAAPNNSASCAILMEVNTGEVLYAKNADTERLIASTTKIMTALVVLDHCDMDEVVKINPEACNVEGSSIYLSPNDEYTVEELLYGTLLCSGNDAATALAIHCGGSVEGFAELMNEKAKELSLEHSSFKNPHGLDADGHYSSCYDLAVITKCALENEDFCEIFGAKEKMVKDHNFINHNKLLWDYEYCTGGKTGYTMAAGRSLVSCAEKDGLKLICVTITAPDDWQDHKSLYNWGFDNYSYKKLVPEGEIMTLPVNSGEKDFVSVISPKALSYLVPKETKLSYKIELPSFVYADIKKGEELGKILVYSNDNYLCSYPLLAGEDVFLALDARLNTWEKFLNSLGFLNKYGYKK